MEPQQRRQQHCKDPKVETMMRATTIHDLPDDLLSRQILLRLDTSLWLIRAACVSKRWRRAVTNYGGSDGGRAFLRLASSSLHPPTVVGQYHNYSGGDHRFVPSSSSLSLPIDGSRFSQFPVDELHDRFSQWLVADCHGGLVLLSQSNGPRAGSVPCLLVYDPLTRKHRWIPRPRTRGRRKNCSGGIGRVFLLDGDDGGDISIFNFKVLHRLPAATAADPQACVFYRGSWRFLSRLSDKDDDVDLSLRPHCAEWHVAGRVDGALYLGVRNGGRGTIMVAIDSTSLVFSRVDLPTGLDDNTPSPFRLSSFTVVIGAGGATSSSSSPAPTTRTTRIVHVCGEQLELFRRTVEGSGEWVLENSIANLSEATRGLSVCLEEKKGMIEWRTIMVGDVVDGAAFAILSACSSGGQGYLKERWFFSIDVNTMELRVLPEETYGNEVRNIFNYTMPWPQFLTACP